MFACNRAPLGKHTWIWCGIGTVIGLSVCCAVLFLFAVLIAAGRIEESGWGWGILSAAALGGVVSGAFAARKNRALSFVAAVLSGLMGVVLFLLIPDREGVRTMASLTTAMLFLGSAAVSGLVFGGHRKRAYRRM